MFGKFSEQLKKSAQPVNSLVALNAKAFEDLSQHQTELFTGLLSESVKYMESVTHQTEVKGVMAANSAFAEAMRERFASVSKDTYSTLSTMGEQVTEVFKQSIDTPAVDVPAAKPTPKVKASPKPAAKPVAKAAAPAEKMEQKTVVAPTAKPAADVKPEVKKATPVAKKTATKKPATRTRKTTAAASKATTAKATPKTDA